jgi:N-acetylglucosaminyl transferase component (Gpi1)
MRDALLWLDDWPEGLKLNTELSSFLVHTLLGVLELWACEHTTFPARFLAEFYALVRHFTFALTPLPQNRIRSWPIWIWWTDRSVIAILGHL